METIASIELDTPENDRGEIRLESGRLICKNVNTGSEEIMAEAREFTRDQAIEYIRASYQYHVWKLEWVEPGYES